MKILISSSFPIEKFTECKENVIVLPEYKKLDFPVSSHADMLFCVIDDTIFCYRDYVEDCKELKEAVLNSGYKIKYAENECGSKYPDDISLNALVIGKHIICNKKHTDKAILQYAEEKGFSVINVNQGYCACSTLVLDDRNAITTDMGIKKALDLIGVNSIFVSTGGIALEPYNCGFIGGATGKIGNTVYFFGEIKRLLDKDKILRFITDLKYNIFQIPLGRVYDFGGFKVI